MSEGSGAGTSSETGTRHLADGMPSYRLVRREDVRARRGAPGPLERSPDVPPRRRLARLDAHGAHARLARRAGTSTRTCIRSRPASTCSRASRSSTWTAAACSWLQAPAASCRSASRTRSARESPARWIEMAAPRPRPDGSDTFFLAPAPDTPPEPLDVRDPRNRNLFLLGEGQMDLDVLKHGAPVGAPTVSSSMATAVLAYSGIAVKMLVDQRLDAQLHTMFMVDYQPGAVAQPHDHPVRGVVLHAGGRGRRRRGRRPVHASARRRLLDGERVRPRLLRDAGGRVRWLETSAPGPPPRHSYRFERDWDYLAERLASDPGSGGS